MTPVITACVHAHSGIKQFLNTKKRVICSQKVHQPALSLSKFHGKANTSSEKAKGKAVVSQDVVKHLTTDQFNI